MATARPIARTAAGSRLGGFSGARDRNAVGFRDLEGLLPARSTTPSRAVVPKPGSTAANAPGGGQTSTARTGTTVPTSRSLTAATGGGGGGGIGSSGVAPVGSNTGPNAPAPGVGVGPQGSQLPYSGDPWTGFSSQYVPGRADDIFSNPGLVLQDVLRGMGVSNPTQSGYYSELEPLADIVNELMLLQNPNTLGSEESAVNYMGSFFNNMSTPGGRAPSFAQMRGNLEGADPMGPLGVFLGMSGGVDQRDQISNFLKMGRAAAEGSLHPYYADAFNNLMAVAANDYMNAGVKGETGNFVDYWNQNYGNYMR